MTQGGGKFKTPPEKKLTSFVNSLNMTLSLSISDNQNLWEILGMHPQNTEIIQAHICELRKYANFAKFRLQFSCLVYFDKS